MGTTIISKNNFKIQKKLTAVVSILFLIKLIAWYLTNSIAILTDTLEYSINVIAGFVGLYSLYISSKPKDKSHPYGHGKVEFLSATIEGVLMIVSSIAIIYEAAKKLTHPHELFRLDYGIYLVAFTAIINYTVGSYSVKNGLKNNSLALIATGKHMQSDTYATTGILTGLILLHFTNYIWIDSLVASIFAIIIIASGYKILRSSIAGIMDEADENLLEKLVKLCSINRRVNWIDIHNLRIIKYGGTLHLDCHLTVPWYFNIHEGHNEVDELNKVVKENFGERVELFIHTDGCLDFSCKICNKESCEFRKFDFEKKIEWTVENFYSDKKHAVD